MRGTDRSTKVRPGVVVWSVEEWFESESTDPLTDLTAMLLVQRIGELK